MVNHAEQPQPIVPNLAQYGIAGSQMEFDQQLAQRQQIMRGTMNQINNRRPRGFPRQVVDPEIQENLAASGYDEHRNRENRMKLAAQPNLRHIRSENGMIILVEDYQNRNQKAGVICAICQEDLARTEKECALLECMHWFHFDCLQNWLKFKSQCPDCKKPVGSVAHLPILAQDAIHEDLDQTQEYERNNQTMIAHPDLDGFRPL